MKPSTIVIIGGSHAGTQLCASLRQEGWDGDIQLIGNEAVLPYHRPPLSKTFLAGTVGIDSLFIRSADFYQKNNISIRSGHVSVIHREQKHIELQDGSILPYDKLALCLGASPRTLSLPGATLSGVHYLRSAHDAEQIQQGLVKAKHAVIIGGGYIGLETAASLRTLGLQVTVLEAGERVLQRVTSPEVSAFYQRVHTEEGVDILTRTHPAEIMGQDRVEAVLCTNGLRIPADIVIIGIGVTPNTALAENAGLLVDNGIMINEHALTNDPHIVAAGDCANFYHTLYGRRLRLESVPNAGEHAKVAAATLCGKTKVINSLPWFWSDQYDLKLQMAGLSEGYDQVVIRGNHLAGRDFSCFYLRQGRIIAADCINRPQEFMFSKQAIAAACCIEPERLADEQIALRALLGNP